MTNKQKHIYQFIKGSIEQSGVSPTIPEMGAYMGVAGSTIHEHLQNMVREGYLKKRGFRQGYVPVEENKIDWGRLYERIEKHLDDLIEAYFIEPEELGKTTKTFVSRKQFVRMLIARIDRDEEL